MNTSSLFLMLPLAHIHEEKRKDTATQQGCMSGKKKNNISPVFRNS